MCARPRCFWASLRRQSETGATPASSPPAASLARAFEDLTTPRLRPCASGCLSMTRSGRLEDGEDEPQSPPSMICVAVAAKFWPSPSDAARTTCACLDRCPRGPPGRTPTSISLSTWSPNIWVSITSGCTWTSKKLFIVALTLSLQTIRQVASLQKPFPSRLGDIRARRRISSLDRHEHQAHPQVHERQGGVVARGGSRLGRRAVAT